jgi:hypothetical protein
MATIQLPDFASSGYIGQWGLVNPIVRCLFSNHDTFALNRYVRFAQVPACQAPVTGFAMTPP